MHQSAPQLASCGSRMIREMYQLLDLSSFSQRFLPYAP